MKILPCIGITGGIGSGKSTAVNLFKHLGAGIIDADNIAHALLESDQPAYNHIIHHFTASILTPQKTIDRKKLRHIVFEHPTEKKWLESLLHPLIHEEIKKQCHTIKAPYILVDIPLLNDPHDFPYLDRILVIDCSEETQIRRIMQRDHITEIEAKRIIQAQITREDRHAFANDYILNDTDDLTTLTIAIKKLHNDVYSLL